MAVKSVNGKCRIVLILPESECRAHEAEAEALGVTINDVLRMKIKGFEPTRRAA